MDNIFLTDTGQIRHHNEDAGGVYKNQAGQPIAIVADGMGGHRAGDVASNMAAATLSEAWKHMQQFNIPEEVETWLIQILEQVNRSIYDQAVSDESCSGMGTTVVIAICTYEFITLAHIGDSRCYLLNNNGFTQLTEDHSLVSELMRSGQITKEEAQVHPRKNVVLKALGTEVNVMPDTKTINWEYGDKLLLCSDGLTDKVSDEELGQFLEDYDEVGSMAQELINLANARGGEDNISLAIITNDVKEEGEAS